MDRGATATATLTSEHFRRSPVVHGGLEIPYKVSVTMPGTVSNLLVLEKYWQLVEDLYTEPKNEEILGSFYMLLSRITALLQLRKTPKLKKLSHLTYLNTEI